jgi:chromosome segregation ATPase
VTFALGLLRLIPWWAWPALGLLGWGWWNSHQLEAIKQGSEQEAHRIDNRRASITQEVQSDHAKKTAQLAVSAAATRRQLADVQLQLDLLRREAAGAQAAERANAERVTVLANLLEEGAGLLSESHARVGALATELGSLQAWVRGVCMKNQ